MRTTGELELQNDLLRHLAGGTQVGIDEHIGLLVKRRAHRQQVANLLLRIGIVEQGTMRLVPDTFPDFFRRRPQADQQGVRLQLREVGVVRRQPAAGGNNRASPQREFLDDAVSERTEGGLAVVLENFRDAFAGARLDDVVGVEEREVHLRGDQLADGGFAGSHEADERNVLNVARGAHPSEVADLLGNRTQIFRRTSNTERCTPNIEGN